MRTRYIHSDLQRVKVFLMLKELLLGAKHQLAVILLAHKNTKNIVRVCVTLGGSHTCLFEIVCYLDHSQHQNKYPKTYSHLLAFF